MQLCNPLVEKHTATTNEGFIARWKMFSGSKDVDIFDGLHTDSYNVPLILLPGDQLHIKLTTVWPSLCLVNKTAD